MVRHHGGGFDVSSFQKMGCFGSPLVENARRDNVDVTSAIRLTSYTGSPEDFACGAETLVLKKFLFNALSPALSGGIQ